MHEHGDMWSVRLSCNLAEHFLQGVSSQFGWGFSVGGMVK